MDYDTWLIHDAEGPNTLRLRPGTGRTPLSDIPNTPQPAPKFPRHDLEEPTENRVEPPDTGEDCVECPVCCGEEPFVDSCWSCKGEGYITRAEAEKLQRERRAEND